MGAAGLYVVGGALGFVGAGEATADFASGLWVALAILLSAAVGYVIGRLWALALPGMVALVIVGIDAFAPILAEGASETTAGEQVTILLFGAVALPELGIVLGLMFSRRRA